MIRPLPMAWLLCILGGCTIVNSRDGLAGERRLDGGTQDDADSNSDDADEDEEQDALDQDDSNEPVDLDETSDGQDGSADDEGDEGEDQDGDSAGDDEAPLDGGTGQDAGSDDEGADLPDAGAGPGPFVLYDQLIAPTGITLRGDDVCWVGGQVPRGLFCAPKDGSGAVSEISRPSDEDLLSGGFDLVFDDRYVYWSNGVQNQVIRRPLAGGAPEEYFTGSGRISYLALYEGKIFATDFAQGSIAPGSVFYGPYTGIMSQLVYPDEPRPAGVAAVESTVFWGTSNPDHLVFGPEEGNLGTTRIDVPGAVSGVAVDGARVVYFIVGERSIYRLPKGSLDEELVHEAPAAFGVGDVALDESWVYWSERDNRRIQRMRR